jgi:hypothetical protein
MGTCVDMKVATTYMLTWFAICMIIFRVTLKTNHQINGAGWSGGTGEQTPSRPQ